MAVARKVLCLLLALLAFAPLSADDGIVYRREIGAGLGAGFSLNDANTKFYGNTGFGGSVLMRFILNQRMAVKAAFNYAGVRGSTEGIDNFYPENPSAVGEGRLNYSFNGGIYDLSVLYELNFLPYGYIRDYRGLRRVTPYVQFGLGMTYGSAGKAFTGNIPLGFGLKWKVARRLNLGLDWTMHFSLSDKLDGLEAPLGIKSTMFKNKDHYSLTMLTLTYDISPKCPDCNRD